ncbi:MULTISPECIES: calcium-binding protein [Asticcacaulis]|uniref:calcium-binding protein n=1 Tax=Asticcacaulis TaxID=76890 RepID=UPI001AE812B5|nr:MULTISPECIES: calcium-binding protein [Asticcacaulis]MBP2159785.1 Ca2+-binding RTX toxin-like protein [Asticcacaulis solisilvae]MDR6800830.1 Ca2+-binding RTX toxin-like protein [Asticcacaulis sp. BE141]
MADYYISPTGSGSKNGVGIENASTLSQLDKILANAQPGDRILLIADQGDYNITKSISLTHGGTENGAITIKGISSAGADMAATFVSNRAETYSPQAVQGQEVFRLLDGADHLTFENMNFQDVNTAFRLAGTLEGISLEHMTADNINRFVYNLATGDATSATVSGLTIKDVDVTGFAKAVVSLRYDTNNVVIEDVSGDSQHIDGSNFATGIQLDGTVHSVVVKDTKMGNITDTVNKYWNGDGFATEKDVYDVAFINTYAYNNTDAGYDLKSSSTTLVNAVAEGNTRNFRFWATDTVLENVTGLNPVYHGGSSTLPSNIWLAANAKVTVKDSEFTDDTGKALLFDLKNSGTILTVENIVTNQTDASDILSSLSSKLLGVLNAITKPTLPAVETPVVDEPAKVEDDKPAESPVKTSIDGTALNDALSGTVGDDTVFGHNGQDVLDGGAGSDTLDGGRNEDVLNGGDGNDSLFGGVNADTIQGQAGDDVVYGDVAALTAAVAAGNDNVEGGDGNDVIFGDGEQMVTAQGGKDYLWGGNGNDVIYGDAKSLTAGSAGGKDVLYGDDGNDTLYGDGATSDASAGGDDKLYGGKGNDVLHGGGGNDLFVFEGKGFGNDVIADFSRSEGNRDKIDLSQMKVAFEDLELTVVGKDTVITFASGDTLVVKNFTGLTKDDIIAAVKSDASALKAYERTTTTGVETNKTDYTLGSDAKTLAYQGSESFRGVANDLDNLVTAGSGADTVYGRGGNDKLYGLDGNDQLYGGDGNDTLYGRQDNDNLSGDAGNDNLMGDGGNDVLNGGRGNDNLSGGADSDRFVFSKGDGNDVIADFGTDDFIDFSGTSLKFSDVQVVDTGADILLRYGADSILLKGVETVDSHQFIFA